MGPHTWTHGQQYEWSMLGRIDGSVWSFPCTGIPPRSQSNHPHCLSAIVAGHCGRETCSIAWVSTQMYVHPLNMTDTLPFNSGQWQPDQNWKSSGTILEPFRTGNRIFGVSLGFWIGEVFRGFSCRATYSHSPSIDLSDLNCLTRFGPPTRTLLSHQCSLLDRYYSIH